MEEMHLFIFVDCTTWIENFYSINWLGAFLRVPKAHWKPLASSIPEHYFLFQYCDTPGQYLNYNIEYCTYRPIFPKQKSYLYIASVIFNATWSNNLFSNFLQLLLYAWSKLWSGTHIYLLALVISAFSWVLWS